MATWLVQLKGDQFDLEDSCLHLQSSDWKVVSEDGAYFLHLPEFDSVTDPMEAHRFALERLPILSALAMLRFDAHPIEYDGLIRIGDDGRSQRVHLLWGEGFAGRP